MRMAHGTVAVAVTFAALAVIRIHYSAADVALGPKGSFTECDGCPEMVVVPAGSFTMGSPADESGRFDNEGPQHAVTISRPFAVSKFEVTVDQFAAFVKETGYDAGQKCSTYDHGNFIEKSGISWRNPGWSRTGNHPVLCVSWDDAKAFVQWLTKKTGNPYRLLSEAEWEYAARAGSQTRYFFGTDESRLCDYANGADRTASRDFPGPKDWTFLPCTDGYAFTAPVGTFSANNFGLHDMHGNVSEWIEDCWHDSYDGAPTDGSPWIGGRCDSRVLRGGSWSGEPRHLRAAMRADGADLRSTDVGMRVARTLNP